MWRTEETGENLRPKVLSGRTLGLALTLHVLAFLLLGAFAIAKGLFETKEEIIPIDLTVVVNENLDGKENEPPPLNKPEPPKPEPKPKPKPKPVVKKPDPPKALEQIVTNVVEKVEKKEEKAEKKEEKKDEPPKKTAKELREERIKKMQAEAKKVNKKMTIEVKNQPSGNGRTDRKTLSDAEIRKLLNMGYKAGTSEQIATSDLQLGYSLIKMAVEAKWSPPPWTDTLRPMTIRVWFGPGGRIMRSALEQSSGDRNADRSIKEAVAAVGAIPGLPQSFIDKYKTSGVPCKFTVRPN